MAAVCPSISRAYSESVAARSLLVVTFALASTGYPHIMHPAHVTPGFSADALVAPTRVGREDPNAGVGADATGSAREYDLQVDLRYGWAFANGRGLQVDVMAPWAISGYAQLRGDPDLGAGIVVGPDPGVYAMIGKAWLRDGRGLDLDAGARLHVLLPAPAQDGMVPNGGAFASIAYTTGALRAGLLAEHLEFASPVTGCDEACMTSDYTLRRTSVGLFVGRTWE